MVAVRAPAVRDRQEAEFLALFRELLASDPVEAQAYLARLARLARKAGASGPR